MRRDHDALGKEARRRLAAVEGEVAGLRDKDGQGAGLAGTGAADSVQPKAGGIAATTNPPMRPLQRREYPDLATLEPAEDDAEVFGDAWSLIVEWRELKGAHPNEGNGLAWLQDEQLLLEVELALLEEHGLTLPPEQRPLRGFARSGQISWRSTALDDTRKALARRELWLTVKRWLTLGRWRR